MKFRNNNIKLKRTYPYFYEKSYINHLTNDKFRVIIEVHRYVPTVCIRRNKLWQQYQNVAIATE